MNAKGAECSGRDLFQSIILVMLKYCQTSRDDLPLDQKANVQWFSFHYRDMS